MFIAFVFTPYKLKYLKYKITCSISIAAVQQIAKRTFHSSQIVVYHIVTLYFNTFKCESVKKVTEMGINSAKKLQNYLQLLQTTSYFSKEENSSSQCSGVKQFDQVTHISCRSSPTFVCCESYCAN